MSPSEKEGLGFGSNGRVHIRRNRRFGDYMGLISQAALLCCGLAAYMGWVSISLPRSVSTSSTIGSGCHPPLPPVLLSSPAPHFAIPSLILNRALSRRTSSSDIDSLSLAVITPTGEVFKGFYGSLRANETDSPKLDEKSLYRVASISKMFAVMELMVLKEQGILGWDDPVSKYLKNFTVYEGGWSKRLDDENTATQTDKSITLRQLASHMSGIGRDYPPIVLKDWPHTDFQTGNLSVKFPDRVKADILHNISSLPLLSPPYTQAQYSNAGFDVLGWSITAAADKTATYADLMHHDIFEPLGLGSSFNITEDNALRAAISSNDPGETDLDMKDTDNPAGGQFSSLEDLIKVMRGYLKPEHGLISAGGMREWVRPIYPHPDDLFEEGMVWEIVKVKDAYGVPRRFYGKGGNLQSHHSSFMFNPASGYGVIVLMTGRYSDAFSIGIQAIQTFQPSIEHYIFQIASQLYGGIFVSEDGKSKARLSVQQGGLWMDELILDGEDILRKFEPLTTEKLGIKMPRGGSYAIWWAGRGEEFRLAIAIPGKNGIPLAPCYPAWAIVDALYAGGAPLDLFFFKGSDETNDRRIVVPSIGTELLKKI